MFKKILIGTIILVLGLFLFLEFYVPPLSENHGKIHTRLYLGDSSSQALIVGFGGGSGGNDWERNYLKEKRDEFLRRGYAFLAIGYFNVEGTPDYLDRISLNAIHDSIISVSNHPKINSSKIALIGASKGGELVLNLASRYEDIDAVVAMSTSHVSFPATTIMANTSSWSYNNQEIAYVPAPYAVIPYAAKGDLLGAFSIMLENKDAVASATIEVEKINGSILLMSAKSDEQWPSTAMSNEIINRLSTKNFPHYYEHIALDGEHAVPLKHFDKVFSFLDDHFLK